MTIVAVFPVGRLSWPGRLEPGFPSGVWVGQGAVTGNASGGTMTVQLNFQDALSPLQALMYHLGQVSAQMGDTTADVKVNIETNLGRDGVTWRLTHSVEMIAEVAFGISTLRARDSKAMQGYILGSPANAVVAAPITFRTPNINLVSFTCYASGYVWDQEALQRPGGPRLPQDGPFGSN